MRFDLRFGLLALLLDFDRFRVLERGLPLLLLLATNFRVARFCAADLRFFAIQ